MAKLIAELCQNHNGDFNVLEEMVAAAAESGADYAKIQSIDSVELTFRERFENGLIEGGRVRSIKRPYRDEYERLKKLDLNEETQINFHNLCKKHNIEPMTTIFTRSKINLINQMKLKCLKISSFDCASFKLIDELKNDPKGKTDEIKQKLESLFEEKKTQVEQKVEEFKEEAPEKAEKLKDKLIAQYDDISKKI